MTLYAALLQTVTIVRSPGENCVQNWKHCDKRVGLDLGQCVVLPKLPRLVK